MIANSGLSAVICDDTMKSQILRVLTDCPSIRTVVSMDCSFSKEEKAILEEEKRESWDFEEIFEKYSGDENVQVKDRDDNDIFSLLYTSGSTGVMQSPFFLTPQGSRRE